MSITIRRLVLPALLLVLVIGCGGPSQRSAELSGTVKYQGKPVTGGNMTLFIGDAGYPVTIDANGSFSANQLPPGEAVVTVDTEALNPNKPKYPGSGGGKDRSGGGMGHVPEGKGGASPGTYVKVPPKYHNKDKSDLRVTLKAGKNQKDFELTD